MTRAQLLIGDGEEDAQAYAGVRNPWSGDVLAEVPLADRDQMVRSVEAAAAAFPEVRKQEAYERAELLGNVVEEMLALEQEFITTISNESGKPVALARIEFQRAVGTFTIAAEEARRTAGELYTPGALPAGKGRWAFGRRFPLGVVAAITPFNFPLNLVAHKVAPCLAVGNTMVLKPAIKTPLTAYLLGEVLREAGMVPGQVNVVTCRDGEAAVLWEHPAVAMVSFTGSDRVGWMIREKAPKKRVVLELGGNAAVLIHEDADWKGIVPSVATGAFAYAGQSCISVQRILVHRPIYTAFRDALVAHVRDHVRAGDPSDPSVLVGPMINREAAVRAKEWMEKAVAAGATLLCGGTLEGNLLQPTLLENVPPAEECWAKEAFAPLAVLQVYDTFDEAIALANRSVYGLQAGVFTRDMRRIHQAFEELEVGGVLINEVSSFRLDHLPYGGIKESGTGREGVRAAMDEMTELKTCVILP
jgi:acyl-CoA reductase-like NAD-dependent aldehyde dehydrogenase